MSEPRKKTPESYSPLKPEILSMAEIPDDNMVNGVKIPFLFKKQVIHLPKSKLVGKKVTYPIAKQGIEGDDANPPLNLVWQEYKKDGTRDYLIQHKDSLNLEAFLGLYFDIDKYHDGNFSYLVGALMKADSKIPERFAIHEIPESDAAICWYKYRDEDDIWSVAHGTVEKYMEEQDLIWLPDVGWCSELYPFGDEVYKAETGYNILGYLIACQKK